MEFKVIHEKYRKLLESNLKQHRERYL